MSTVNFAAIIADVRQVLRSNARDDFGKFQQMLMLREALEAEGVMVTWKPNTQHGFRGNAITLGDAIITAATDKLRAR